MGGLLRTWRFSLDHPQTVYYLAVGYSIATAPWVGPLGWCVCAGLSFGRVHVKPSVLCAFLAVSALTYGTYAAITLGFCCIALYAVWLESFKVAEPEPVAVTTEIDDICIEEGFSNYM